MSLSISDRQEEYLEQLEFQRRQDYLYDIGFDEMRGSSGSSIGGGVDGGSSNSYYGLLIALPSSSTTSSPSSLVLSISITSATTTATPTSPATAVASALMANATLSPEDLETIDKFFTGSIFDPLTEMIIMMIFIILISSGFLFNTLMLIVILLSEKLRRMPFNLLLLNLCASNILLSIFCMPFTLMGLIRRGWFFGAAFCKIIPSVQGIGVCVSATTVTVIALDRYFTIVYRDRHSSSSSASASSTSNSRYRVSYAATTSSNASSNVRLNRSQYYQVLIETIIIWFIGIICGLPVSIYQKVIIFDEHSTHYIQCIEDWPRVIKAAYSVTILIVQCVLPAVALIVTGSAITSHLKSIVSLLGASNATAAATATSNSKSLITMSKATTATTTTASKNSGSNTCYSSNDNRFLRNNREEEEVLLESKEGTKEITIVVTPATAAVTAATGNSDRSADLERQQQGITCSGSSSSIIRMNDLGPTATVTTPAPAASSIRKIMTTVFSTTNSTSAATTTTTTSAPTATTTATTTSTATSSSATADYHQRNVERNQLVTRTLLAVSISFTVCWMPLHILNALIDLGFVTPSDHFSDNIYLMIAICSSIAMTSVPLNALLYGWYNPSINREVITWNLVPCYRSSLSAAAANAGTAGSSSTSGSSGVAAAAGVTTTTMTTTAAGVSVTTAATKTPTKTTTKSKNNNNNNNNNPCAEKRTELLVTTGGTKFGSPGDVVVVATSSSTSSTPAVPTATAVDKTQIIMLTEMGQHLTSNMKKQESNGGNPECETDSI